MTLSQLLSNTQKSTRKSCTLLVLLFVLSGCRSAFVATTIRNNSDNPLHLIEVDYPSASFGTQTLAAHGTYHYHFKIQGSGPITITFTDTAKKVHTVTGPALHEGQQGALDIAVDSNNAVSWTPKLSQAK